MKRKVPIASLDQFYKIQKEKKPVAVDAVIPIQRTQLSVVKSQISKNITRISITSLFDDPVDIDEICREKLETITDTIEYIFSDDSKVNFAQVFNDVEFLCKTKSCEEVYNTILPSMEKIAKNFISSIPPEFSLSEISALIRQFETSLTYFQKIFTFLDRTFIYAHRIDGHLSIKDVFYAMIKKFLPTDLCKSISDVIISNIQEFRLANPFEATDETKSFKESLKTCVLFAQHCKFYLIPFEAQFLLQTQDFFTNVSNDIDLVKLLAFAHQSKEQEKQLFAECGLLRSTYDSITNMFNTICLESTKDRIFSSQEFFDLIQSSDIAKLKEIANLYSETDDLKKIVIHNYAHFWANIVSNVLDNSSKKDWIPQLLDIAVDSFKNTTMIFGVSNNDANKIVKQEIRNTIKAKNKIEEIESLLAKYIDNGAEFDAKATTLFKLVDCAECFEASYSYLLRKRILKWQISIPREKNIAMILEKEKSKEYVQRINELINDYKMTLILPQPQSDTIDYRCLWLHATNSTNDREQPRFPPAIDELNTLFLEGIKNTDQKRIACFSASLSICHMSFNKPSFSAPKTVIMTGEQAIILLKMQDKNDFFDSDQLSKELCIAQSNVEENLRIFKDFGLVKEENGRYLFDTEQFCREEDEIQLPPIKTTEECNNCDNTVDIPHMTPPLIIVNTPHNTDSLKPPEIPISTFYSTEDFLLYMLQQEEQYNALLLVTRNSTKDDVTTKYYTFKNNRGSSYKVVQKGTKYKVYDLQNPPQVQSSSRKSSTFLRDLSLLYSNQGIRKNSVSRTIHEKLGIDSSDIKQMHCLSKRNLSRLVASRNQPVSKLNQYESLFEYMDLISKQNSQLTKDDQAFIISIKGPDFEENPDDFFWAYSSSYMIKIAKMQREWFIDATYNIIEGKGLWIMACKLFEKVFPFLFFLCPDEKADTLSFILSNFKDHIEYEPDLFMHDCQKSITLSIGKCFDSKQFLCMFHILRAVRKSVTSLATADQVKEHVLEEIHALGMLEDNISKCNERIEGLKIYLRDQNQLKLLDYFEKNWFNNRRMWCAAFGEHSRTNNVCESLNNKLKSDYNLRDKMRIDILVKKVIEEICPDFEFNSSINRKELANEKSRKVTIKNENEIERMKFESLLECIKKKSRDDPEFPYKEATAKLEKIFENYLN